MKFTYRAFPFLKVFNYKHSDDIIFNKELGESVIQEQPHLCKIHADLIDNANHVDYISNSVQEVAEKALIKHKKIELINDLSDRDGFLFRKYVGVFYCIRNHGDYVSICLFFHHNNERAEGIICAKFYSKKDIVESQCWPGKMDGKRQAIFLKILSWLLFLEFADLENYVLDIGGGKKKKIICLGDKYISEIPIKINIIDSTYFRTIIRNEGFSVSGHFAYRRHGKGRKKRRIVWIDSYEKKGYKRVAKKSKTQTT